MDFVATLLLIHQVQQLNKSNLQPLPFVYVHLLMEVEGFMIYLYSATCHRSWSLLGVLWN